MERSGMQRWPSDFASLTLEQAFLMGAVPFAVLLTYLTQDTRSWRLHPQIAQRSLHSPERHNEDAATIGKAIMEGAEGARGGCLAALMADAGWHGKVTGLSDESKISRQVAKCPGSHIAPHEA